MTTRDFLELAREYGIEIESIDSKSYPGTIKVKIKPTDRDVNSFRQYIERHGYCGVLMDIEVVEEPGCTYPGNPVGRYENWFNLSAIKTPWPDSWGESKGLVCINPWDEHHLKRGDRVTAQRWGIHGASFVSPYTGKYCEWRLSFFGDPDEREKPQNTDQEPLVEHYEDWRSLKPLTQSEVNGDLVGKKLVSIAHTDYLDIKQGDIVECSEVGGLYIGFHTPRTDRPTPMYHTSVALLPEDVSKPEATPNIEIPEGTMARMPESVLNLINTESNREYIQRLQAKANEHPVKTNDPEVEFCTEWKELERLTSDDWITPGTKLVFVETGLKLDCIAPGDVICPTSFEKVSGDIDTVYFYSSRDNQEHRMITNFFAVYSEKPLPEHLQSIQVANGLELDYLAYKNGYQKRISGETDGNYRERLIWEITIRNSPVLKELEKSCEQEANKNEVLMQKLYQDSVVSNVSGEGIEKGQTIMGALQEYWNEHCHATAHGCSTTPFPSQSLDAVYDPEPEVTHSLVMKFRNGDIVEVPPPEGDGWKKKIVHDEWTPIREGQRPPVVYGYEHDENRFDVGFSSHEVGGFDNNYAACVSHDSARMLGDEYLARIDDEDPDLLSLTMWTREFTVVPCDIKINVKMPGDDCVSKKDLRNTLELWPQRHPTGPLKYDR